jgi:hypothetical protein
MWQARCKSIRRFLVCNMLIGGMGDVVVASPIFYLILAIKKTLWL